MCPSRSSGNRRSTRRTSSDPPLTPAAAWPVGPVATSTGTVELVREPGRDDAVTMLVNGVPSSFVDLADPRRCEFEYLAQMLAVIDLVRPGEPVRVVHLGAGGCTLARAVDATRPGSRQLAVELDATLPELVRTWFGLPRAPALRLRTGDAREVLTGLPTASADVVVRDAFASDRTPPHLVTTQMAQEVRRVLRPGGVYLANCADRPPLGVARREVATLAGVFGHVALIAEPPVLRGRRYGNLVLVAGDEESVAAHPDGLERALRRLPVPATAWVGPRLDDFTAGAAPMHDEPPH